MMIDKGTCCWLVAESNVGRYSQNRECRMRPVISLIANKKSYCKRHSTPDALVNLRKARRQFKVAEKFFHSARKGPDFTYKINGRSAYEETARKFDNAADYLRLMAMDAAHAKGLDR